MSTGTFYSLVEIVCVAAVAVDKDAHDDESAEYEVGIADGDSDAPVHRFYGALLRFHRGGRLPLSVVGIVVVAAAAAAALDTGAG
jgi:hypothetical protein